MTLMIIALIINFIIVLLEIDASINQFRHDPDRYFIYYTHLSNIFAGITSVLYIISGIAAITGGAQIPVAVKGLRLMSTTTVAVTFVVVITILAPSCGRNGYRKMLLEHNAKYVHLLCPLLSIISFLFFEAGPKLQFYWTLITLIPTLIYGAVAVICNYRRVWDGPYDFLKVHDQTKLMSAAWGLAILGGGYLIGVLLWYFNSILW